MSRSGPNAGYCQIVSKHFKLKSVLSSYRLTQFVAFFVTYCFFVDETSSPCYTLLIFTTAVTVGHLQTIAAIRSNLDFKRLELFCMHPSVQLGKSA